MTKLSVRVEALKPLRRLLIGMPGRACQASSGVADAT
jgi:hypothetical protein